MVFPSFVYGRPPRPLRVLVADDNADATDSLATLLRMAGCEVAVAYEGFAVVPVAERFGPDACVLDVRMPGVDGWEVGRRLRAAAGGTGSCSSPSPGSGAGRRRTTPPTPGSTTTS